MCFLLCRGDGGWGEHRILNLERIGARLFLVAQLTFEKSAFQISRFARA
jgi:hypothetical protein